MTPTSQPFLARDGTQLHIKVDYHVATGQYIIPWADITDAFPQGYLVKNGDTILPFLSDQDETQKLLIEPLCVAYQDNAVLEVVYEQSIIDTLDSSFWPTRQFRRATHLVTEQRLSMAVNIADALSGFQPAFNILSHNFLYQDDSKPRLFIVLPTTNNYTGIHLDQYRLYYLCEHGGQSRKTTANTGMTVVKDSSVSHDAHLAEHGGYKIIDTVAFFEKYGEYVLAILCMVKYGASAGGIAVPRLLQFGGVEGQEADDFRDNVDDMIHYLQQYQQQRQRQQFLSPAQTPLFSLRATAKPDADADTPTNPYYRTLTKTWLKEEKFEDLDSFLENHYYNNDDDSDGNTTPADLHRVTTVKEGHVRWVCSGHFSEHYPQVTRDAHIKSIQPNQGTYNIHTGVVKVRITTTAQAKKFYLLLAHTPFFKELCLSLDWTLTTTDLKDIILATQQSFLHRVELFALCENHVSSNDRPMVGFDQQPMHLYLAHNRFRKVQLKNREGLPIQIQKWPNAVNTNTLSLRGYTLSRRDFSMLSFLLRSAPHLTSITLQVDSLDVDPVLDMVEAHIEQYKKIEQLSLSWKSDSHVMMSFKSGRTIPSNTIATLTLANLDLFASRITLDSITDLNLGVKNTPSEVDLLVQVLLACCTSLKNLCLSFDDTHEDLPFSPLSIFELGSIPTLASIRLSREPSHYQSSFTFPLISLDLRYMNIPLDDLSGVNKIITKYPSLATLSMTVYDLDAAYGDVEPFFRRLQRDMTVRLEHKLGSHVTIRFKHTATSGDTRTASFIELRAIPIKKFRRLPLDQVQTLGIPSRSHVYQHDEIIEITQRCTSLETLEINVKDSLSLAAFCVSTLPAIQSIHLITSRSDDNSTYQTFPLKTLDMAGRCLVTVIGGVSAVETFFKSNPKLSDLSFTVTDIAKDFPAFISAIKSLSGHRLSRFVLKDVEGSVASISFDNVNNNIIITSYFLHLKRLARQEDLQIFDISSLTDFVLTCTGLVNVQPDKIFRRLVAECPRLMSIDIQCDTYFFPTFFYLSNFASLKTCVLRNRSGQVVPNLNLVDGYLNLGNELLSKELYPDLHYALQSHPNITGLKILVESTFEAYEFITSLAAKTPWLEEVKIAQQNVGPKLAIAFADDVAAGTGRIWTVALDVRSLSQLQPKMFTLLTKLTVSGQVMQWTNQDLANIPLASCENLSTLELKCPPSQFPRILRSLHDASLMHTSLRHLKLWDGSRDNILTGSQIDDLDAIAIHIQQVRMLDFHESLQELESLLQDYPLEIAHLKLNGSFNHPQAEIIEKSLKLGKVRIRHIQWDISFTRNFQLFETMLRAVSHCYTNAASSVVPTVAFKVCKNDVARGELTMYQPGADNQNQRVLSALGHLMTQFATHLILDNAGLEIFLPDLLLMKLEALQELEIRVTRYCPDDEFLEWLRSVFQRRISQAPANGQQSYGLVAGGGCVQVEDYHDSDFIFDDPMSSSVIMDDISSPPQLISTTTPLLAPSPNSPTLAQLTHPRSTTTIPTPSTRQPFSRLIFHNLQFKPPQWKQLLESMDFVSLRLLSLERVGFGDHELMLLTTLYIDQLTRTRKERQVRKEKEIKVVGEDGEEEEEGGKEQEDEECVVRFYTTSVTQQDILREQARLKVNSCSQLKFVLV
ncbi:hypothetical protein BGZ95_003080 [Linnemannia exigua]|uniref:Uncharacterized protein n=1 Tax=Linnemannia exigua TaxID=604196 RepID=A0AAD4D6T1_9FUNG|nr:hypothetical protein BGZ95_003080 [Linnemannia exigua]